MHNRLKWAVAGCLGLMAGIGICRAEQPVHAPDAEKHEAHAAPANLSHEQVMARLEAGNVRYVKSLLEHPDQTAERRTEVAKGQKPFAIILGCSDSRVPPEILFDAGLGDLFVIRVAGNTADDAAIGSIEYAVSHFGVSTIVVLGHERCGAVDTAVKIAGGPPLDNKHLAAVLDPIKPAVEKVLKNAPKDQTSEETVNQAVWQNVGLVVEQLKASKPLLADLVAQQKLTIVGRRYDLDTGKVQASTDDAK